MNNHYVKQILKVLIYIEDHIEDEMTIVELAKVACYSPFHFHRIFQAIVGESIHKYVRRLRLESAAGKLLYSNQPITGIALDANFDTSSSFTKAFKQCMGKSPRNYRLLYKEVNMMTRKINELSTITPKKIEKVSDLNLMFIRRLGNYTTSSELAWDAMKAFIKEENLDKSKLRYFSITHDDPQITNEEKLRFDACIQTTQKVQDKGEIGHQTLKGGKYAVFVHQGSTSGLDDTFDRIYLKWLPNSKENLDESRPPFCEHLNTEYEHIDDSKFITNIFVPLL